MDSWIQECGQMRITGNFDIEQLQNIYSYRNDEHEQIFSWSYVGSDRYRDDELIPIKMIERGWVSFPWLEYIKKWGKQRIHSREVFIKEISSTWPYMCSRKCAHSSQELCWCSIDLWPRQGRIGMMDHPKVWRIIRINRIWYGENHLKPVRGCD
jgi:hypothetical protein